MSRNKFRQTFKISRADNSPPDQSSPFPKEHRTSKKSEEAINRAVQKYANALKRLADK